MCTRTIILVAPSICITIVAIFMSLDSFKIYRQQLWDGLPHGILKGLGNNAGSKNVDRVLSKEELALHNGKNTGKGIYLAILGKVFDVSAGSQHYGPDGGYSFFAGKDATRAYVSGDFTAGGLVEDFSGLSTKDMVGIEEWIRFFESKYIYIGKVEGLFYDVHGEATAQLNEALKLIQSGHHGVAEDDEDARSFPPCNSAWTQASGSQVWCTNKSGGIARDWVGVPRRYFRAGSSSSRCACVRTTGSPTGGSTDQSTVERGDLDNPHLREYPDCDPTAIVCQLR